MLFIPITDQHVYRRGERMVGGMYEIPKYGYESLTHTLTHMGLAADGQASIYWTDNLRVCWETGVKNAKSRCASTEN